MSDFPQSCLECGSCLSSESSMLEHDLDTHFSRSLFCRVCRKGFDNSTLLKRHVSAHQDLSHCCNICGELCKNKIDVFIHVTTSHKYEGKMVCDLCSKAFSTDSCLKSHSVNEHAEEMPQVLKKWELFCNIHSSRSLFQEDLLNDSFYSFDCFSHPKEKESRDKTNYVRCSVSKSNQSILSSKRMDDSRKRPDSDCSTMDMEELQNFFQQHVGKESWYTKSTDHLSNSIRPHDILERVQSQTNNKNRLQNDQSTICRLCRTIFSNRNDYLHAHGGQDPYSVCSHKLKKSILLAGLEEIINKIFVSNTSHIPSKESIKDHSSIIPVVIHEDRSVRIQNGELKPNGTLFAGILASTSQIQNKNPRGESQKEQFDPNVTSLPDLSALTI